VSSPSSSPSSQSRRDFLGKAVAGVAAASLTATGTPAGAVQARAASAGRVLGANDRIRVGLIGCGMQGNVLLDRGFEPRRKTLDDFDYAAVCDVWQPRLDYAQKRTAAEFATRDYREVLARKDIDGVVVVVPDHSHYRIASEALLAGKDVYLEKPMTYTIDEARKLHDLVQQTGRMLQVGGGGPGTPLHWKVHEYIKAGRLGKVAWGLISYNRNTPEGAGMWDYPIPGVGDEAWPDAPVSADTLDWRMWLGPANKRPFSAERYFRWRKYWEYSGGNATDLLFHRLGAMSTMVGFDFPVRVTAAGGIYLQKNREVPDTYMTLVEYPGEYTINMVSCMANATSAPITVYGNLGTLEIVQPGRPEPGTPRNAPSRQGTAVIRAERHRLQQFREANEGQEEVRLEADEPAEDLIDNWLNAMRSRQTPVYDVLKGYQVTVAINLGVQAYREGRTMAFDPVRRRVLDRMPPRQEYPPAD